MTAPETAPPVREVHPLGGMTREEALRVYDAGLSVAPTDEQRKFVVEMARRMMYEQDQLARAADYNGRVLEFVIDSNGYTLEPLEGEALALELESTMDLLERGDSETCENLDEFLKGRKKAKKQKKRDRVLLAEAADARCAELQDEIENGNLPRRDVSRMKRELAALHGAAYRAWERIQK